MTPDERDLWLAERRKGIGASDAAAILGLSPWKTAMHVYLEKLGKYQQDETEPMKMGTKLEPIIAELYTERTGRALRPGGLRRHQSRPWQLATLDRFGEDRDVQLKTVGAFAKSEWGEPGTEEIPEMYLAQVQHEMAVTGRKLEDVAVLFAGQFFAVYTVPRNDRLIEAITERELEFWERVQRQEPPEPDWAHHVTRDVVKLLYGFDEDEVVNLGAEEMALVADYERLGHTERIAKDDREMCKAKLLYAMKDAARAELPDGSSITRKQVTRKAYSVSESVYFDFRIKRPKGRAK